jgi:hypothetical protein
MVTIEKQGTDFIFEINGLHKLWTLRSQLKIPAQNVKTAYPAHGYPDLAHSLRLPGTHVPGIISAGTYHFKDATIFCDVVNPQNSIVVELQDEHLSKLIIEVADPQAAITMLAGS